VADWRTSLHQGWHETWCSPGPGKSPCPPVTAGYVEPAGAARERKLSYLVTAETAHDPFGDIEPANRSRRRRYMPQQPTMLGDGPLSAYGLAGCRGERVCSDVATQRLDLLLVAIVMPRDDRRDGSPVPVDKDAGFAHAGDANGRDAGRAGRGVQSQPECFDRGIEQLLGGEFHAVRRGDPWGAGATLADNFTLIGEDDRFRRRGPHVKPYEKCHVQNLRVGCGVMS
jgi:hypothetical protein